MGTEPEILRRDGDPMRTAQTLAGDTLDLVAYRIFGYVDTELLKSLYALNPDLIALGPILPPRTIVRLPETVAAPISTKIQLYD